MSKCQQGSLARLTQTGTVSCDTPATWHLCAPQVVDYYRKKGAVSDIKAEQDSERVQADIRTVLKDTARS